MGRSGLPRREGPVDGLDGGGAPEVGEMPVVAIFHQEDTPITDSAFVVDEFRNTMTITDLEFQRSWGCAR
jgi:hypothetical protein